MDVDYGKIKIYPGNYDFWYQSNQLIQKQMKESNKKKEEKIKELKDFIARFGASQRSKQATSRKKTLEKIQLDEIVASNRRYPYIDFSKERQVGKEVIKVSHIWKENGEASIRDLTFDIKVGDKVLVLAENENKITTLFNILAKEVEPDKGYVEYGQTITTSYLPKDNNEYFKDKDENLVDWLRKYSKDPDETYLRGFLGRMLFSGEEARKKAKVLSGGEKVRCMLSKMMLSNANVLLLDNPTDHLDLESITSLNKALERFDGTILFTTHDHEFIQTIANKIIEITPKGILEKEMEYDDYLNDETVETRLNKIYRL